MPESARIYLQKLPALNLMDRFPAPVLAFDRRGIIGYANDAFVAMLGYPDFEHLRGRMVNEIAGEESRCTSPTEQIELLGCREGSVTTWRHYCGHSVSTIVSPIMRLRVFDPLAVMALTQIARSLVPEISGTRDVPNR